MALFVGADYIPVNTRISSVNLVITTIQYEFKDVQVVYFFFPIFDPVACTFQFDASCELDDH